MAEFKFQLSKEEWEAWRHNPVTKEAQRYLHHLEGELKDDWAEGAYEGKTQEETGYLSSMARNRMIVLQTIVYELFEGEISE
jgi:hypothetical protein